MKRSGFTLIELITSIAIFLAILIAVYSAFHIGLKTWERQVKSEPLQKIRIGLLKFQKDLRSSFFFSKVPCKGTMLELSFPIIIQKESGPQVCVVTYKIEGDTSGMKKLLRTEKLFTEDMQATGEEETKEIFSARSIHFTYAYKSEDSFKDFEWLEAWDASQEKFPSGIKISFTADDSGEIYNKIIFIPQGKLGIK